MQIQNISRLTDVPRKTIRYYESIGVLPEPERKPNGYRTYTFADIERLKLVSGLRKLEFSLDEVSEVIAMRDRGVAPCGVLLEMLGHKAQEIQQRITELHQLEEALHHLRELGRTFPLDDVEGKNCVCHLVSER